MTTSLLNRILKIAVTFTVLCVLAMTNLLTSAAAAPQELIKNGGFVSNDWLYYPAENALIQVANDWRTKVSLYGPYSNGNSYGNASYLYSWNNSYWGRPESVFGVQYNVTGQYPIPASWVSDVMLSQVVTGLQVGQKYAVSFDTTGMGGIGAPNLGWPDPGPLAPSYWQVSLTDRQGHTKTQNSDVVGPARYILLDCQTAAACMSRFTVKFTATDIIETLGFAMGAGPGLQFPVPACVPCGTRMQLMFLDNVSMTAEAPPAPTLTVQEAMGGNRIADTDQFTMQIVQNSTTVVNSTTNSTTTGNGSVVNAGSGTTGVTNLVSGTSYMINEAPSGTTKLAQYNATLSCTDAAGANKTLALNTPFTLQGSEAISCTLTMGHKVP